VAPEAIVADLERSTGMSRRSLEQRVVCHDDAYDAAAGAHALAVMTEWDQFRQLDFERIYRSMHKPAFAFDGRNILPHAALRSIGFQVHAIGKPAHRTGPSVNADRPASEIVRA
jgi:UDPglucose 6-dehydrogenase